MGLVSASPVMVVTDRRGRQAGAKRQAPSDNQAPAHSCRRVHTGAISKRLASVTRQGSLLERLYRLTLGKRARHLYAWHGMHRCPGMTVSTTLSFTAHLSLQCVHNLTRRKRLANACRLPPASVCNRHNLQFMSVTFLVCGAVPYSPTCSVTHLLSPLAARFSQCRHWAWAVDCRGSRQLVTNSSPG